MKEDCLVCLAKHLCKCLRVQPTCLAWLNILNSLLTLANTLINEQCIDSKDLHRDFSVLSMCMNTFDCLLQEMLLIRQLTPSFNVYLDSVQAKLFAGHWIYNYVVF